MSDTNSFIEKKVQLLEDITCHEDFCFQKRRKQNFETDYCECNLKDAKSFLRSALRDHAEYLKDKVEGMIEEEAEKSISTPALFRVLTLLDKEITS